MHEGLDLAAAVPAALLQHPRVRAVELVGSRARGTPTTLSDWDFTVDVENFASVATDLPSLVQELEPLAQQWDRLGPDEYRCYMLLLEGARKVDLIFPGVPHRPEPPWVVAPDTLEGIDHHFWDWILWLTAKEQGGKGHLVQSELGKLTEHLLRPMGVECAPRSIHVATVDYRAARERLETSFRVRVPRRVELDVLPVLRTAGWAGGLDLRTRHDVE